MIGIYPIKIILCGGIVGFIIITTAFKNIKGKITKKDIFCNVKININKRSVFVKAIVDTGNFLKEPITNMPVIVIEKEVLRGIIPDIILNNLISIINGKEIDVGEYATKIRIIPFTSLGKQNGILIGIKADSIVVNTEEHNILIENIIIGMYDGVLTKTGKYRGLIGLELLEDKGGISEDEYIRNIKV